MSQLLCGGVWCQGQGCAVEGPGEITGFPIGIWGQHPTRPRSFVGRGRASPPRQTPRRAVVGEFLLAASAAFYLRAMLVKVIAWRRVRDVILVVEVDA